MKSRFTYREWFYVNADENLYDLSPESLFIYRRILKYAS